MRDLLASVADNPSIWGLNSYCLPPHWYWTSRVGEYAKRIARLGLFISDADSLEEQVRQTLRSAEEWANYFLHAERYYGPLSGVK
jgi:hypothetical protein